MFGTGTSPLLTYGHRSRGEALAPPSPEDVEGQVCSNHRAFCARLPARSVLSAPVTQLVEWQSYELPVTGSSPVGSTFFVCSITVAVGASATTTARGTGSMDALVGGITAANPESKHAVRQVVDHMLSAVADILDKPSTE